MSRTLSWLVAFLAFASLTFLVHGAPMQVMSAPNLLRVGTAENIFVECQGCTEGDIRVEIFVKNYPTKTKTLASTTVTLNGAKGFQALGEIVIPADDFNKDPNIKQYVYLQAQFPGRLLEKVVLVSFQSGHIFIQTDKTLYTPNSKVNYRMFALTPRMEPIEREGTTDTPVSITIEIVTPGGIILSPNIGPVSLQSGIHSGIYQLPELASSGLWKVVAKFHSTPQQSYSAEFEVKEYVLPSFEVKLTSESPFFYVDSEEFTVNIKAEYLFGEEVNGMAYVVFGIMQEGGKMSFPDSLQRVRIVKGNGVVKLKRQHITEKFRSPTFNIQQLVGSSIYVAVTVLTENGNEMVEAELRNIQIVTSPYTIHLRRTPKYFKPGMSFDVVVEVVNPDDSPAQNVAVVVDPGHVEGSTAANGMARLTVNTEVGTTALTITAKTNDPRITRERQATATMEAQPYKTTNNNYIHIDVGTAEQELGDNLKVNFNFPQQNQMRDFTYLILSRGQLVKSDYANTTSTVFTKMVRITKELLPSFRIVAYFHTDDNEVVADSVWVDVKDSCMGSLKLEISRPSTVYMPRKTLYLKVTGDPGATVKMVAVDKGVYVLNNKHRLTQKKVWDVIEKYDTGCTPGGGKDSMSVFYDAGLLFVSSTASGTPYRHELKCPAHTRRKRTTIMDVITSLTSQYKDQLQRECCKDGLQDSPLSYSCERRSKYIVDGEACVDAFLHCCKEMENQRAERRQDSLQLARSEEDESYMDTNEIVTRTKFDESWLWIDINLPACSKQTPNCDTTSFEKDVPLQDSITTWQFTGISLSRTHGICVGESLEVIVRKDFFIDLRLPYSAVRGEQVEIKAILHNYNPDEITVRLDLSETEHVCSVASKRRRYRQEVTVGGKTSRAVPFVIIPMKDGQYPIEVKAAVKDSVLSDGIMKKLRVVPAGVLVTVSENLILNPAEKGEGGVQEEIMRSQIPMKDVAPNTPSRTEIFVRGADQVAALVENAISGNSMGTLIYEPSGCGEQNMIHMTLPVIATTYLDKANQWESVGFEKRNEALRHINIGYENELNYRKDDGSFAVYPGEQSSTWLTAYVVKVFAMAKNFVAVQNNIICDAVKFLILNAQQPDGMFIEVGKVYSYTLNSEVDGIDSDASMTAFCLIAMQEAHSLCRIQSLSRSIGKAVAYLENRLPSLTYSYAVAMTSYALANADKLNRQKLLGFAADSSHWPVSKGDVYTLEATAYALLALVKSKAFEDARPVVRWFNEQQRRSGNYGSTQATIMVYQAIAEYWANAPEPEYNLNVDVQLPGRSHALNYTFNRGNFATKTSNTKSINEDVKVTAKGTGEAVMTMVSMYYALPKETENNCQNFNLSVRLIPVQTDGVEKTYKLKINYFFKNKTHDASMSILDIGLLTGFTANTNELKLLSSGHAKTISKYEMNTALSEKGSLIIYLEKVSHTQEEEVTFMVHQKHTVGILQPAAVSIYEYYEKTPCVKYYHPERKLGELMRLCRNDECTCAEENCSMQKKGKISNALRTEKSCETTPTSKIDFVYKVSLEKFEDGLSTDIYTMQILKVIKGESYDVNPEGQPRIFLSYPHCRKSLDLKPGKNYLIMGSSKDIHRDDDNRSFQYVLGERTWIEYWPTPEECQNDEHRETCVGLENMEQQYDLFGCGQ